MKKGKDDRSEERGPKTEESSSEEEEAEEMTGAKKTRHEQGRGERLQKVDGREPELQDRGDE
eukprot:14966518-Heterocapsa_arctica.AAC.1